VLDFINTAFADQARGREQLLKYLSQALNDQEPTALFVITPRGVRVITDFTTDPNVLATALRELRPDPEVVVRQDSGAAPEKVPGSFFPDTDSGEVQYVKAAMADALHDTQQHLTGFETRAAATLTMEAMQQIAHALEGVPGRKSLIWASGGFPFAIADTGSTTKFWYATDAHANVSESVTDMLPLYAATWRALNQAQVSVYPVDIRGIVNEQYVDPSIQHPGRDYVAQKDWQQNETLGTFKNFADMTGGKAFFNSNDLAEGFREAVSDSSHYYLVGYYLQKSDRNTGWHKLEVKVKRGNAKVRARSGFLVTKGTASVAKLEETDIQSALLSPLDFTALPFRMQWTTQTKGEAGKVKAGYEISIAPGKVEIDAEDTNHLELKVIAAVKSPLGKLVEKPFVTDLQAHLPAAEVQQIAAQGLKYTGEVELAPGEYNVRMLLRDGLTGKMGSIAAPLIVK
jgi:VWFA-related protein